VADETDKGLTKEELEQQSAEPLPDREAMSVVWIEPDPMPPAEDGSQSQPGYEPPNKGENEPLGGGEQL
jgi:hypothetical protein